MGQMLKDLSSGAVGNKTVTDKLFKIIGANIWIFELRSWTEVVLAKSPACYNLIM